MQEVRPCSGGGYRLRSQLSSHYMLGLVRMLEGDGNFDHRDKKVKTVRA